MKTMISRGAALAVAGLFLTSFAAAAATFTANPTADAFVTPGPTGNLSSNNYGSAGALGVSAPGSANGEFQSFLQFNLSGAKSSFDSTFGVGNWTLLSVSLQLTTAAPNNGIFNNNNAGAFGIQWEANNSWTEGTGTPAAPGTTGITFASAPSFKGAGDQDLGAFTFAGGTSGTATYSLSLASGLVGEVDNGGVASIYMVADDANVSYLFNSRNNPTTSVRPVLTLIADVPEPGAVSLFATGILVGLGSIRVLRRK